MTSRLQLWTQDLLAPTPDTLRSYCRSGSTLSDPASASTAWTLLTAWKETLRIKSPKWAVLSATGVTRRREAHDEDTSQGLGDLSLILACVQALGLQGSTVLAAPQVFLQKMKISAPLLPHAAPWTPGTEKSSRVARAAPTIYVPTSHPWGQPYSLNKLNSHRNRASETFS